MSQVTPVMFQNWTWLTFVHWRYPIQTVAPFLPPGLEVDPFDGTAWVGMTPFYLRNLRPPFVPAIPWLSGFPETNVRTYVCDRNGDRGIWFFSLDAARLVAVVGARVAYGLPYRWAQMSVKREGPRVHYKSSRITSRADFVQTSVEIGSAIPTKELEFFLAERYRLYTTIAGALAFADVAHEPWPLQECHALRLEQSLLPAAGLPAPQAKPLLHFSKGVHVRIGRLQTKFGTGEVPTPP